MARRGRKRTDTAAVGLLDGKAINSRLSASLRAHVDLAAAAANLSDGAWLRALIVEATGAPPEEAQPTLPVEPVVVVPLDLAAIGLLERSVRRLTGAVVQLALRLREGGHANLHADTETVLADLTDMRKQVTTVVGVTAAASR